MEIKQAVLQRAAQTQKRMEEKNDNRRTIKHTYGTDAGASGAGSNMELEKDKNKLKELFKLMYEAAEHKAIIN